MDWNKIGSIVGSICLSLAKKLLGALLLLIVGRSLIRYLLKRFSHSGKQHLLDPTAKRFLLNIVKFFLYTALGIGIVGILGIPLASVITVIGAAGAAIALALQGSLANLASGIMLLIFKPIRIGDYVEAGDASGTVTDLGLFYTTLLTPDNCHYAVPNTTLTTATIKNYSREETRRLDLVFTVDYTCDLALAKQIILHTVSSHGKVRTSPSPFVRITELADSAIAVTARVWCKTADYWDLKFDLTELVRAALDDNGITAAYPQLKLHIKK